MTDYLVVDDSVAGAFLHIAKNGVVRDRVDLLPDAPETTLTDAIITATTAFGATSKLVCFRFVATTSCIIEVRKNVGTTPVTLVRAYFGTAGEAAFKVGSDDGDLGITLVSGTMSVRATSYTTINAPATNSPTAAEIAAAIVANPPTVPIAAQSEIDIGAQVWAQYPGTDIDVNVQAGGNSPTAAQIADAIWDDYIARITVLLADQIGSMIVGILKAP